MRRFFAAVVLLWSSAAAHASTTVSVIRFVESGGPATAFFSQCAQIGTRNDVVTYLNGNGNSMLLPGKLHVGDVVCVRPISSDLTLSKWRQQAIDGRNLFRKNGKLQLLDASFNVVASWTFAGGWLSKISYDPTTETIVLTSDQLSRDGTPLAPPVDWTPQPLTYGELLGANQLNATSSAAGSFAYDPPAGTLLPAGSHTLHATFTPSDPTQFSSVTVDATVTVNRAVLTARADDQTKAYGAPNPALTYSLTGFVNGETTAVISGAPILATAATTTSDAGTYPITIEAGTLGADNYSFQFANGTLTITKADQTIHWSTPDPIVYGTILSSTQLNATVSVVGPAAAGALTYSPAAGALLDAGDQLLTVAAAETLDYNPATASVHLTVMKATPSFSDLASPVIAKGTATTTLSGKIAAGAIIPPAGETVSIALNGATQPAPIQSDGTFSSAFATGALPVSSTPYPIAYNYAGDRNFNATSGAGSLTVAYLDAFSGTVTTPAADNDNANRPFRAKFSGGLTGSIPGDFTAFINYAPAGAAPNLTSTVTDGTWKLHADNKKPLPKGIVSGRITGGTIQWNSDGTAASVNFEMTIDSGNGDFAHAAGTALFRNGTWSGSTLGGQLLLFY